MAWLETHPTSGRFKICFRWSGKKLKRTIKTTCPGEADAKLLRFEENIKLLEEGRLELPLGADICTFLLSDGKLAQRPSAVPPSQPLTLAQFRDCYVDAHSHGAMEDNSLATVKMHLQRLKVFQDFQAGTRHAAKPAGDPVLIISEVRKREPGHGPLTVADLLGSTRLGYTAEAVLLLQPAEEDPDPFAAEVPLVLNIAKGRDGVQRTRIKLIFEHARSRFREKEISVASVSRPREKLIRYGLPNSHPDCGA